MYDEKTGSIAYVAMWVITKYPSDYPNHFVVREQRTSANGIVHSPTCTLCQSLEQARRMLPPGLVNIGRSHGDDPVIVEVWI